MENIRLILLLIGAVIVAGIYIYGRLESGWARRPKRSQRHQTRLQEEELPAMHDLDSSLEIVPETDRIRQRPAPSSTPTAARPAREVPPAGETTVIRSTAQDARQPAPERKPAPPGKIFPLFVMAPAGVPFRGPLLLDALEDAQLEYGEMQIFHRHEYTDGRVVQLFSAANIREPGTLDPAAMASFTTQGIVLFLQVTPGIDAVRAFDIMVETAKLIADELGGTVCDATRSFLTKQTIGHLREEVIGCQLQQRVMKTGS